jgi:predicted DNA-binding antitoxin AbrB/MazE fold protein
MVSERYNRGMAVHFRRIASMQHTIEAIYEDGAFRPVHRVSLAITEGQRVRIIIDDEGEPEALRLVASVYNGPAGADIDDSERIALARGSFFSGKSAG